MALPPLVTIKMTGWPCDGRCWAVSGWGTHKWTTSGGDILPTPQGVHLFSVYSLHEPIPFLGIRRAIFGATGWPGYIQLGQSSSIILLPCASSSKHLIPALHHPTILFPEKTSTASTSSVLIYLVSYSFTLPVCNWSMTCIDGTSFEYVPRHEADLHPAYALVCAGYISPTLKEPQITISLWSLELLYSLFQAVPTFSIQHFAQLYSDMHKVSHS